MFSYDLPFESMFENCNLEKAIIDIHDFYYEIVNSSILTIHIELCVQNIIEDPIVVNIEVEKPQEEVERPVIAEEQIEELVREKIEETGVSKLDTIEHEIQELFDQEEMETSKAFEDEIQEAKVEVGEERPAMIEEKQEVMKVEQKKEEQNMEAYVEEREQGNKIDEILEQMDTKETYATYKVYIVRENDSLETIIEKYDTSRDDLALYNDLNEIKIGDKIMIPSHHA